jgi:hypothetical protein
MAASLDIGIYVLNGHAKNAANSVEAFLCLYVENVNIFLTRKT